MRRGRGGAVSGGKAWNSQDSEMLACFEGIGNFTVPGLLCSAFYASQGEDAKEEVQPLPEKVKKRPAAAEPTISNLAGPDRAGDQQ